MVSIFASISLDAKAFSNPPSNDSICNAIDLGVMPSPGFCPNNPDGDTISFFSSTNFATFNPAEFSATHCFGNPSPDVWYKLRATGSYLYVEMLGFSGLNNFFIKLHHSQGSCLSLVPLDCITSSGNVITYSFLTPEINGEYYLQIGGSNQTETGDFYLKMKSYNDCTGCVKKGDVHLSPAPTLGRYNLGEVVTMCATVTRWEALSTSYLHSIVPEFGPDWDLSTLTPVVVPTGISNNAGWHWLTGIATPNGPLDGFFFDGDGDGDPTNNAGDNGTFLSSWTGCWSIATAQTCGTNDVSVDVNLYSDDQTGTSNAAFLCWPLEPIHISTSTFCCAAPDVQVFNLASCAPSSHVITITGDPSQTTHTFNYYLIDTSFTLLNSASGIIGPYSFSGLNSGEYIVAAEDVTAGGCVGYQTVTIDPDFQISVQQTNIGCFSGSGEAIVSVLNATNYSFTYNWLNIPAVNQTDSLAFNLSDGWVVVSVTDTIFGCMATDSVFIISYPVPDPTFACYTTPFCNNVDTIPLQSGPASPGGFFSLVNPISVGITVDAINGSVYLNNSTFAAPYWVYINYNVGGSCSVNYTDSVLIVQVPPSPTPLSAATQNYCQGGTPVTFTVQVPNNMFAYWYDAQNPTSPFVGTTFTPPINASSPAGTYFYTASTFFTLSGGCASNPVFFVVNVIAAPQIITSNDTTICVGDTATLSVSGCPTCTFLWSPAPTLGLQNSVVAFTSPASSTTYTIVATENSSGCIGYNIQNVFVDNFCDSNSLIFYHGLTPNGDGHNDYWLIDGIDSLSNVQVEIYNRWGKKVWYSYNYNNYTNVWDGKDKNQNPLPDGTYFFIVTTGELRKTGWIELSH